MASRGRSSMASAYGGRSSDSSPDPLGMSVDENRTKTARRVQSRDAMVLSSPSKQNRRMSIPDIDFMSPAKSMIMNTPRTGGASPWRIKVTVQAEPESGEENSPTVQRFTRTKTTTVPLKDPDAQSPTKRGPGRPRKSDTGTTPKPKRKGTPVKRAPRSRSRDTSVGPFESGTADADTDAPPKRRRGRPRKSIQPSAEDGEPEHNQNMDIPLSRTTAVSSPAEEEGNAVGSGKSIRFETPDENEFASEPMDDSPVQTPPEPQTRVRKGTPHAKRMIYEQSLAEDESDEQDRVMTPHSEDDQPEFQKTEQIDPSLDRRSLHESSVGRSRDDHSSALQMPQEEQIEVSSSYGSENEDGQQDDDVENFVFDEGTTRMPDDTTVLDSENFSMISVDSLPSNGGGFSSPPKPDDMQQTSVQNIDALLHAEQLHPQSDVIAALAPKFAKSPAQASASNQTNLVPSGRMRPPLSRFRTPVIDNDAPVVPPAIEPAPVIVQKTETPKIGRVVTAGVALQGALDPVRVTPDNLKRDAMDDLFRGFSEGTRKELQAGLRLGAQLAEGSLPEAQASSHSSPAKARLDSATKPGVFRTQRKHRQPRLLTPEDQEDDVTAPVEPPNATDVQYPTLNTEEAENPLLSPAESDDEMSWRIDTPPAGPVNSVSGTSLETDVKAQNQNTANEAESPSSDQAVTGPHQENYADIWQEEASRTSLSADAGDSEISHSSDAQDLFTGDVVTMTARGKLPRTRRRKITDRQEIDDLATTSPQQVGAAPAVGAPIIESLRQEDADEDISDASEASDDTGMFFQSNMPRLFSKKRSSELRQRKVDKQSLSSLLDQGESLLPDSSPPVLTKSTPSTKANPFTATPPRFPGFPSSPSKSSPLRRELRGSDISSDAPRHLEDESTLPIFQSSPFHTFVDGDSKISAASDQRQFRYEMEGSTSASIRQVRNEANEYLEAYETQERTLEGITEITEPSRTWHGSSVLHSNPPRRLNFARHLQSPVRQPLSVASQVALTERALHRDGADAETPEEPMEEDATEGEMTEESSVLDHSADTPDATSQEGDVIAAEDIEQRDPVSLHRGARPIRSPIRSSLAIKPHPILPHLTPLPKVEPWTKTHYKALDKLFSTHQKHPALFSPSVTPVTPLSTTNTHLLQKFLAANKKPYVGATYSVWGYSMEMTEDLLVLCAVYMENLSLATIEEYESKTGKQIKIGDCGPGRSGDAIKGDDIVKRLVTIVLGEEVRRDEARGLSIDRSRQLEVEWPPV